jgi:hypothetical protein
MISPILKSNWAKTLIIEPISLLKVRNEMG